MPHFTVEYSANLENDINFDDFFAQVHDNLGQSGVFPLGGIRSRAIRMDHYRVADNQHDYAFVHCLLKIGSGRDLDTLKQAGDSLFAVIEQYFEPIQAQRLLAISFEMQEIHPTLTYKKNNIHAFLKQQQGD